MKKAFSLLLILLMIGSMTACTARKAAPAPSAASGSAIAESSAAPESASTPESVPTEESASSAAVPAPQMDLPITIDKPYTALKLSANPGAYVNFMDILQLGNTLLVRYVRDGERETGSVVELFDLTTGKNLEQYEIKGIVGEIEKTTEAAGFDYRILGADGITYKNSTDPAAERKLPLPQGVNPAASNHSTQKSEYDLRGDSLVWRGEDGVYLAKADGSGAKKILTHTDLTAVLAAQDEGKVPIPKTPSLYIQPRLLDGGKKVAATIYAPEDMAMSMDYTSGIALYDVASGKTDYFLDLFGTMVTGSADYPDDTTAAAFGRKGITLIDAPSAKATLLPFPLDMAWEYTTLDYKSFLICPPDKNGLPEGDRKEWNYYLTTKSRDDVSHPVMTVKPDSDNTFYVHSITANYIISVINGDTLAAIRYE